MKLCYVKYISIPTVADFLRFIYSYIIIYLYNIYVYIYIYYISTKYEYTLIFYVYRF